MKKMSFDILPTHSFKNNLIFKVSDRSTKFGQFVDCILTKEFYKEDNLHKIEIRYNGLIFETFQPSKQKLNKSD